MASHLIDRLINPTQLEPAYRDQLDAVFPHMKHSGYALSLARFMAMVQESAAGHLDPVWLEPEIAPFEMFDFGALCDTIRNPENDIDITTMENIFTLGLGGVYSVTDIIDRLQLPKLA